MKRPVLTLVVAVALAGCATIQLPPERLEQSQATRRAAEELGARDLPSAKLYLQYAKDEEASARQLAQRGDSRAELILSCSQADADLSLTLAREAREHQQTVRAAEEVNALRSRGTTP